MVRSEPTPVTRSADPRRDAPVYPASRSHLPELDGLRAAAVWTVVFYHLGVPWVPGAYGVELFFVLSGYLISILLVREFRRHARVDYRRFFIRRALRIMPAFYGYLLFATAWKLVRGTTVQWPHLASAATYTVNFYNAFLGDPNSGYSHAWSLAIEQQFYLVWPFALVALLRRRLEEAGVVIAIAAVILLRFALHGLTPLPQSYYYASFEMRADALLAGALLACLTLNAPEGLARAINAVGARSLQVIAVLVIALLAAAELRRGQAFRDTITATVLPVACAAWIAATVALGDRGQAGWLSAAPVTWLGRLSYSTYLYQQMVPGWGLKLLPGSPRLGQWFVEAACALLLACGSFYIVEQPLLRLKNRVRSAAA